jgi:tetratricopeptide (TPR) repeat protein
VLYSEKDPERGQSRIVEPDLLQRVAGDFAPSPAAPQVRPPADADFAKLSAAAEQARQAGRLDEAAPLYRQALALRTEWREGWWALGTILYDQDAHAEAARAFDRLVALDASNGTAHLMLALCEYQLDRNASAMEHIQAAKKLGVQKDGGLPNVLAYHEAMLLLRAERYERALDALQPLAAAGMDDENLDLALGMSVLLIRAQDAPAEGSDARRVVIQAGRAERHFLNKAFEAARSAWEALVRDWPAFPNLRYAFGRFLLDAGNLDAGIAEFQAEIANQPDHVRARMLIAAARYRVDSAAAIPFAREAVTLRPRYPFGHYLLGLLYLDVGEIDRAVAELETASRLVPTEPQFHFSLGSAYARAGRAEDAARARAAFSRLRKDDSAPQPDEAGTLRRLDLDEVPGAAPPSRKQP